MSNPLAELKKLLGLGSVAETGDVVSVGEIQSEVRSLSAGLTRHDKREGRIPDSGVGERSQLMADLVVLRGEGDSQGEDVVDPLLTADNAAISRGRVVLDEMSGLRTATLQYVYKEGLKLGDLVGVLDARNNTQSYGKVTSISYQITATEIQAVLKIQSVSELPI